MIARFELRNIKVHKRVFLSCGVRYSYLLFKCRINRVSDIPPVRSPFLSILTTDILLRFLDKILFLCGNQKHFWKLILLKREGNMWFCLSYQSFSDNVLFGLIWSSWTKQLNKYTINGYQTDKFFRKDLLRYRIVPNPVDFVGSKCWKLVSIWLCFFFFFSFALVGRI